MRPAKANNPAYLHAINPYGSARPKTKRPATKKKNTAAKKKNPSTVRAARNPFDAATVMKGVAAGVGAIATTFISNMLPLPTNGLLNAGVKAAVGYGLGVAAKSFGPFKAYADYVGAGGIGVGAADALRFAVPRFRQIIVPTEPEAAEVKAATNGQLQDVVFDDYLLNGMGGMSDVTDSMPFRSDWASAPM